MKKTMTAIWAIGFLIFGAFVQKTSANDHPSATQIVFDGKTILTGRGWGQKAKMTLSKEQAKTGKLHLDFNAQWDEGFWAEGGWNWTGWNKDAETVDISQFRKLRFWIKRVDGDVKDLYVQLASRKEAGKTDQTKGNRFDLRKNGLLGKKIAKKYIMVEIPLDKLSEGSLNKSGVWEIIFGIYSAHEKGKFRLFIDNIEFVK